MNIFERLALRAPEDGTGAAAGAADAGAAAGAAGAADAGAAGAAAAEAAKPAASPLAAAMDKLAGSEEGKPKADGEPKPKEGEEGKPAEYVNDPNKSAEENAAAKKAFDEAKEKAAKEGETVDPASFKIEVPEGFTLDKEVEGEFRQIAADLKLNQEQFDKLKGVQLKLYEKQRQADAETLTRWAAEIKADPELGGADSDAKMGKAAAAIDAFFEPEGRALIRAAAGHHPEIVRGFYRLGVAMGEMPSFRPGASKSREGIGDILFGERK